MRPSLPRLVRLLPRSAVVALPQHGRPPPRIYEELPKDSRNLQKEAAGPNYPSNIRIEPVASKKTFAGVKRDLVAPMKAVLRER
ncbi:hypothetical protein BC826DRAFT_1008219 [Russula brevipes]|nr:hypothetical protein BC826DRAFT_1008219 [Russula brevipes]